MKYLGLLLIILTLSPLALAQAPGGKAAGQAALVAGKYSDAVTYLRKVIGQDKDDADAWLMLGTAYYHLNKFKDAVKALEKAVSLKPGSEVAQVNLAMSYLARNDPKAEGAARAALALNKQNAGAMFVLASFYYQHEQNYRLAFEYASSATRADPKYAAAYFVISRSLVASFLGVRDKAVSGAERAEMMKRAVDALDTYAKLIPESDRKGLDTELHDLRFFAEYYGRPENNLQLGQVPPDPDPSANVTPLKILSKPRPSYTESARQRNVQGTIVLLIGFDADGKIGPILVLKSLDRDLDGSAIAAARGIKFVPPSRDGKPISVVKQVEYSFSIY